MLFIALSTLISFVLIFGIFWLVLARRSSGLPEVWTSFSDTRIRSEIAASTLDKARGLAYRASLEDGRGMLFEMNVARRHSFWMQGMRFPIDIIWLRDGVVVDISSQVAPEPGVVTNLLRTYSPRVPADQVLEVPSGYAATHNIVEGSRMLVTTE